MTSLMSTLMHFRWQAADSGLQESAAAAHGFVQHWVSVVSHSLSAHTVFSAMGK